jgi:hypothetical protein
MSPTTPKAPNYDEEVDFQALAMIDSEFAKIYDDANGHVDFHDPKAIQQVGHQLEQLPSIVTDCYQTAYQECLKARFRSQA